MFEVIWLPDTDREIEAIFIETGIDRRVLRCLDAIEQELKTNPLGIGIWRTSSVQRLLVRDPLTVEYSVILDDYRVKVYTVTFTGFEEDERPL